MSEHVAGGAPEGIGIPAFAQRDEQVQPRQHAVAGRDDVQLVAVDQQFGLVEVGAHPLGQRDVLLHGVQRDVLEDGLLLDGDLAGEHAGAGRADQPQQ